MQNDVRMPAYFRRNWLLNAIDELNRTISEFKRTDAPEFMIANCESAIQRHIDELVSVRQEIEQATGGVTNVS